MREDSEHYLILLYGQQEHNVCKDRFLKPSETWYETMSTQTHSLSGNWQID